MAKLDEYEELAFKVARALADNGVPAVKTCEVLQMLEGYGFFKAFRAIRAAYGFDISQTKEAFVMAEGYPSLSEYQASLADGLEEALETVFLSSKRQGEDWLVEDEEE